MIQVNGLRKIWRREGKTVGLLGVGFTIPDGQIVGVLGENGAGKTTLLRLMSGLLQPQSGTVLFDGRPAAAQYARISYMTGEGSYYPTLTVGEYGQLLAELNPNFDARRYDSFLNYFALEKADVIGRMSTGQRARLELAAGFAKRADYYLMDEPFLGKDPFTRRDFIKLMGATLHGNETILLSTHHLEDVEHFLDRALIFHKGSLADDVLTDALHERGETLLQRMTAVCHGDGAHHLEFDAG